MRYLYVSVDIQELYLVFFNLSKGYVLLAQHGEWALLPTFNSPASSSRQSP